MWDGFQGGPIIPGPGVFDKAEIASAQVSPGALTPAPGGAIQSHEAPQAHPRSRVRRFRGRSRRWISPPHPEGPRRRAASGRLVPSGSGPVQFGPVAPARLGGRRGFPPYPSCHRPGLHPRGRTRRLRVRLPKLHVRLRRDRWRQPRHPLRHPRQPLPRGLRREVRAPRGNERSALSPGTHWTSSQDPAFPCASPSLGSS
jgi:hypothetical protein